MSRRNQTDAIDEASTILYQARALGHMLLVDDGDAFRSMGRDLQDSYLLMLVDRVKAAHRTLGVPVEEGE